MLDVEDTAAELARGDRAGQFLAVGLLGAGVDMGVLAAVLAVTGLEAELAKVVSAEASIVVMFVCNERWTFRQAGVDTPGGLLRRLAKSNVVRAGGFLVALVVLSALTRGFGVNPLLANAVGIGAGFAVNYVFETLVTWQAHT